MDHPRYGNDVGHSRDDNNKRKAHSIALVALLSFALLINYVDRGSIGIAAPLIQTEFNLSASQKIGRAHV